MDVEVERERQRGNSGRREGGNRERTKARRWEGWRKARMEEGRRGSEGGRDGEGWNAGRIEGDGGKAGGNEGCKQEGLREGR